MEVEGPGELSVSHGGEGACHPEKRGFDTENPIQKTINLPLDAVKMYANLVEGEGIRCGDKSGA